MLNDDFQLQATLRQNAHNNKLRKNILDTEETIASLHTGEYTNAVQYSITQAFKKSKEYLLSAETALKWNLTSLYDLPKLMRQCGLELSLKELYRPDQTPNYFDLVPVAKEFSAIRAQLAKSGKKNGALQDALSLALANIDQVTAIVKGKQFDAQPAAQIPEGLIPFIKECSGTYKLDEALQKVDSNVRNKELELVKYKQVGNAALTDGEVALAEEASYAQIRLLEELTDLVGDQMAIIRSREDDNSLLMKAVTILRDSNRQTLNQKQNKRMLKQRCETDLLSIHTEIGRADAADVEALRKYAEFRNANDESLERNITRHSELFTAMVKNKYTMQLESILNELRDCGRERYDLMIKRLEALDNEERRKVEYQQFLEISSYHKTTLECTIDNCESFIVCIGLMEQAMNAVSVAIINIYLEVCSTLSEQKVEVHKSHYVYFREIYLQLGNLLYKKEKKIEELEARFRIEHVNLELCHETFNSQAKKHSESKKLISNELGDLRTERGMLRKKLQDVLEEFRESEEALKQNGFDFVHPADELEAAVMEQMEKMVIFKSHFYKEEEVRIAAEWEELRRVRALRSAKQGAQLLIDDERSTEL